MTKAIYKRIVDRVQDDQVLSGVDIPLPNINAKSTQHSFQDKTRDLKDMIDRSK